MNYREKLKSLREYKIYIKNQNDVPEGVTVQTGPNGGQYYISNKSEIEIKKDKEISNNNNQKDKKINNDKPSENNKISNYFTKLREISKNPAQRRFISEQMLNYKESKIIDLEEKELNEINEFYKNQGKKPKLKDCFANAQKLVTNYSGKMKIEYVEGFYQFNDFPIPLEHAWVRINGKDFDPTMHFNKRNKADEYYGKEYSKKEIYKNQIDTGRYTPIGRYISGNKFSKDNWSKIYNKRKVDEAIKNGNNSISPEKQAIILKYKKLVDEGKTTKDLHTNEFKEYNEERKKLHDDIIKRIFENAKPDKEPEIVFLAGLPGSGKTSIIKQHKLNENSLILSSDDIKEMLPEYDEGYASQIIHEESSDILKKALSHALDNKFNVILDGTMKSYKRALENIESAKGNGYKTRLVSTEIPVHKSIERATERFNRGGRYAPYEMINDNAKLIHESMKSLKTAVDNYMVFDTNVKIDEPVRRVEKLKEKLNDFNLEEINKIYENIEDETQDAIDSVFSSYIYKNNDTNEKESYKEKLKNLKENFVIGDMVDADGYIGEIKEVKDNYYLIKLNRLITNWFYKTSVHFLNLNSKIRESIIKNNNGVKMNYKGKLKNLKENYFVFYKNMPNTKFTSTLFSTEDEAKEYIDTLSASNKGAYDKSEFIIKKESNNMNLEINKIAKKEYNKQFNELTDEEKKKVQKIYMSDKLSWMKKESYKEKNTHLFFSNPEETKKAAQILYNANLETMYNIVNNSILLDEIYRSEAIAILIQKGIRPYKEKLKQMKVYNLVKSETYINQDEIKCDKCGKVVSIDYATSKNGKDYCDECYKNINKESFKEDSNVQGDESQLMEAAKKIESEHLPTYKWIQEQYEQNGTFPSDDEFITHIITNHTDELGWEYYRQLPKMESDIKAMKKESLKENTINLIRVIYGKKDTVEKDREYQIDGKGPVGTLDEWKAEFPMDKFNIRESYKEKLKNLREYARTIDVDGQKIVAEISGSGNKAFTLDGNDKEYNLINGKWEEVKKESWKPSFSGDYSSKDEAKKYLYTFEQEYGKDNVRIEEVPRGMFNGKVEYKYRIEINK